MSFYEHKSKNQVRKEDFQNHLNDDGDFLFGDPMKELEFELLNV